MSNFRFGEVKAADILKFKRHHWGIENYLHRVRDVEMGEDAHYLRVPGLAQILAALSNAIICLLQVVLWNDSAWVKKLGRNGDNSVCENKKKIHRLRPQV